MNEPTDLDLLTAATLVAAKGWVENHWAAFAESEFARVNGALSKRGQSDLMVTTLRAALLPVVDGALRDLAAPEADRKAIIDQAIVTAEHIAERLFGKPVPQN